MSYNEGEFNLQTMNIDFENYPYFQLQLKFYKKKKKNSYSNN